MINRLVYEVRLRDTSKRPHRWRWDVNYYKTTDPTYPGVETGREQLGMAWGYSRWKWLAVRNISKHMLDNDYKELYEEV